MSISLFCIVSQYINWVKTYWTYSTRNKSSSSPLNTTCANQSINQSSCNPFMTWLLDEAGGNVDTAVQDGLQPEIYSYDINQSINHLLLATTIKPLRYKRKGFSRRPNLLNCLPEGSRIKNQNGKMTCN